MSGLGSSKARSCKSKRRFRSEEHAKTIIRFFPGQRIYFCLFCNGFHCTKKPIRVR